MRRVMAVFLGALAVLALVALLVGAYLGAQLGYFVVTTAVILIAGRASYA